MVEICSCELIEYDYGMYTNEFNYRTWQFIPLFIDHVIQFNIGHWF